MTEGPAGPAIVIGFAASVADDLATADGLFPGAVRFAVNRAARAFRAHHLVSLDRHRLPDFMPNYPITVHAGRFGGIRDDRPALDYVDCYWPRLQTGGTSGSSGWLAAKIAVKLGFGPVVMCGCPIDNSAHAEPDPKRPESSWQTNPKQAASARDVILREADFHPFVRSMSGWTREILGGV